jgi:hypothetical protein
MNRAKLIKRGEILDHERRATEGRVAAQPSLVRTTVETVRDWVRERRALDRVNAREQFAALFS